MEIKIIKNLSELIKNKKIWKILFDSLKSKDLYLHPNWHISWWKSFGKNKKMFIIYLFLEDKLIGVLPLVLYRGELKEAKLKILGFSGGIQSDRNNYILDHSYLSEGINIFQKEIEKLLSQVDILYLHSIPISSGIIDKKFLKNKTYHCIKHSLPYLDMSNMTYENIQKSWKSSHRRDINRQIRRLNKLGKLSFNLYSNNNNIDKLMDDFLKIHSIRWKKKYDKKYYQIKNFYKELFNEFKDDKIIHFSTLKINNKVVSYHFGFVCNFIFFYYKPAYDIEYHNYSPGKIHIAKLIESSIYSKLKTFDFLLGDEKYKENWITGKKNSKSYYVKGSGFYSNFGIWWFKNGQDILRGLINFFRSFIKLRK